MGTYRMSMKPFYMVSLKCVKISLTDSITVCITGYNKDKLLFGANKYDLLKLMLTSTVYILYVVILQIAGVLLSHL